jgi:hypothetical protein
MTVWLERPVSLAHQREFELVVLWRRQRWASERKSENFVGLR